MTERIFNRARQRRRRRQTRRVTALGLMLFALLGWLGAAHAGGFDLQQMLAAAPVAPALETLGGWRQGTLLTGAALMLASAGVIMLVRLRRAG